MATTYYVDWENGDDEANNGLTKAAPFKYPPGGTEFAGTNPTAISLVAGDQVLLARGSVFEPECYMRIAGVNGSNGNRIEYGAYDREGETGQADPVWEIFDNYLETPRTWTDTGNNIWTVVFGSTARHVKLNGVLVSPTYLTTTVTANAPWYYSGGLLYLYSVGNPNTYYNSEIRVCSQLGTSSTPEAHRRGFHALFIDGSSYVDVHDIEFEGSAGNDIILITEEYVGTVHDISIFDCYFHTCTTTQAAIVGTATNGIITNVSIEDCVFDRKLFINAQHLTNFTTGDGIQVIGSVEHSTIKNNSVTGSTHTSITFERLTTNIPKHNSMIGNTVVLGNSYYCRGLGCNGDNNNLIQGNDFTNVNLRSQVLGFNNVITGNIFSSEKYVISAEDRSDAFRFLTNVDLGCEGNILSNNIFKNTHLNAISFNPVNTDMGTNYVVNNIFENIQDTPNIDSAASEHGVFNYISPANGATMSTQVVTDNIYNTDNLYFDYQGTDYTLAQSITTIAGFDDTNIEVDPLLDANDIPSPSSPAYHAGRTIKFNLKDFKGQRFNVPPTIGAYEFTSGSVAQTREVS